MTHQPLADGYLAQLVARMRLGEPVLRRRPPALFEPVQPWAEVRTHDGVSADGLAAAPLPPTPRHPEPSAPGVAARSAHPPLGAGDLAPRVPPAPTEALVPAFRHDVRPAHETRRVDPSIRIVHAAALPATHIMPPELSAVFVTAPAAVRQVDAPRSSDTAPALARQPGRINEAPALLRQPRERGTPVSALASRASTPRRNAMPSSTAPSALQRAADAQVSLRQPQPPPRDLPPVQVTIGRIEVRAVAAPAAASERGPRSAPRMGLEQYLRDRHGGSR
jgi:hypothetical protein